MSPRSAEQFEKIRIDRKAEILEAALEIFSAEGYHSASISKVSKAANVSKGLMYNYFKSKEELLHQLLEQIVVKETNIMLYADKNEFDEATFIEFLQNTVDLLKEDPKHWKLYFLMAVQPEVMKVILQDHMQIRMNIHSKMLSFFEKKGYSNPALQVQYFGTAFGGLKTNYIMDPENYPIDEIFNLIVDQFIKNKL